MKAYLYDAEGRDRAIEIGDDSPPEIGDNSLLWVEMTTRERAAIEEAARLFDLDEDSVADLLDEDLRPRIDNYGAYYQIAVMTAPGHEEPGNGHRLDFLVGERWVITVHDGALDFFEGFRAQDKAETMIGALSAQGLAASLLDWHLATFFEAVGHVEAAVDRLDDLVLTQPNSRFLLARMVTLRRQVSQLRKRLVGQRLVFYGLARPDFALVAQGPAAAHYGSLAQRYERALDEVERGRDLVVGSFELLNSRTTLQTNQLVKALTFVTAIIGFCAAVAGLFGMNFEARVLTTGDGGFYAVVGGLALFGLVSWIVARWRGWV